MQLVKDHFNDILVDLLHLPKNHIFLPVDRTGIELRVLRDVRDDLDHFRQVLVESSGGERGLLPRGVGVETRSEILDLKLQVIL